MMRFMNLTTSYGKTCCSCLPAQTLTGILSSENTPQAYPAIFRRDAQTGGLFFWWAPRRNNTPKNLIDHFVGLDAANAKIMDLLREVHS